MKDLQSEQDVRGIALAVGVRGVRYPITIFGFKTIGIVDITCWLDSDKRAIHMSRLLEVLHRYHDDINCNSIIDITKDVCKNLGSRAAKFTVRFTYSVEQAAPVSGAKSINCYDCVIKSKVSKGNEKLYIKVAVPVTTLCPCSRAISENGAHNQRALINVKVRYSQNEHKYLDSEFINKAENNGESAIKKDPLGEEVLGIINAVEQCASSPVYTLLKRVDEKCVTESAYDKPMFVEDVARDVLIALQKKYDWIKVDVTSYESIHNHNAYACVKSKGNKG